MIRIHKSTDVRKKEIVSAVRKLIIKHGSEHVSIRNIAKEVNLSEAAIYRHFKGKGEVLEFLARDIIKGLIKDIDAVDNNVFEGGDFIDFVLKMHLSSIEQRKGISFQVIAEIISFGDKKINMQVTEGINNYIDQLKILLSKGIEAGLIRKDINLEAASIGLFGMIQGLVNMWALSDYSFDLVGRYESLWKVFRGAIFI
ncbi:MAG: TetR/AcrR family transcriptional regulator [Desulfobacula sp.]|nr:TetR/AcrR family transcriptional regulator [Desulfobacula sp.]